jgi:polar amino acid transport system substrate-binding protein
MSQSCIKVGKTQLIIVSILTCFVCIFNSTYALTQTTLPKQIRIGTRTAAFPIGRVDSTRQIGGFCGDAFQDSLQQELSQRGIQSNVTNQRIANEYKGKAYPRYDGLIKKEIEIECGTNSPLSGNLIDKKTGKQFKEEIAFSNSFYRSGIKLLLNISEASKLESLSASEQKDKIRKLRIGVVKNTTTYKQFTQKVDMNQSPYSTRKDALDALDNGLIQAFATDALIGQNLLEIGVNGDNWEKSREPYKERGFTLFPLKAGEYLSDFDKENYAIAIKNNTLYERELLGIINAALDSIQNKSGLANAEKDYSIPNNMPETSDQPTPIPSSLPSPVNNFSTPDLIILVIFAILGMLGIFAIVVLVLAKGHIFHQYGSGDNVGHDKVSRDKINSRNNNSQDEDM